MLKYTCYPYSSSIHFNLILKEAFPNGGSGASNLAVFIYTTDGSTVLRDDVEEFSMRLNIPSCFSVPFYFSFSPDFLVFVLFDEHK